MNKCVLTFILCLLCFVAYSQGCSDAGFCTMGAMKPDQPFNKKIPIRLKSMEISFYRGSTTLSPVVYVATADMSFNLFDDKTSFQVKIPYQAVKGNFANTSGLGDISVCFTRNIFSSEKYDINVSLGGKIPSNKSDLEGEREGVQMQLPMYYQTSLGTYDLIAGVSLISRDWLFATGIQRPIIHQNENRFLWGPWVERYEGGPDYVFKYDACNMLERGTDVMVRVERNFRFSRLNFSVGLLPIYRITRDEVYDRNTDKRVKLEGTTGMALSAIGTVGYNFNVRSGIKLLVGHKITQRETNPDGLTRELVNTFSYFYRF